MLNRRRVAVLLLAPALAVATFAAAPSAGPISDGDATLGPEYAPDPLTKQVPGVPKGTLQHFVMDSSASATYPKDREGKPFKRDGWVYIPSQYKPGSEADLLVVQDGGGYKEVVSTSLDNLIAQHRLPVIIAVLIQPGPKGERSLEYDTVSGDYCDFIDKEVLPKMETDYHVKFTADPNHRGTMGGSSGGAAAFTMGWFHPERYHLILTYSGSFTMLHPTPDYPHGAWGYHETLIAQSDPKPLRVYLEVGEHDINHEVNPRQNWPVANKQMAAALKAKGYHYHFDFALNAKHVDRRVVNQTLPETLVWLWADQSK